MISRKIHRLFNQATGTTKQKRVTGADLDSNWSARRRNLSEMESMYTSSCQQRCRHSHSVLLELRESSSILSETFCMTGGPARALSKYCAISWNLQRQCISTRYDDRTFRSFNRNSHVRKTTNKITPHWPFAHVIHTNLKHKSETSHFGKCLSNVRIKQVLVKIKKLPKPLFSPHQ